MHFLWKYLELNYWNAFHNLYRQNIAKPFQSGVSVPIVATREMRAREKKKQENENELNAGNEKKN